MSPSRRGAPRRHRRGVRGTAPHRRRSPPARPPAPAEFPVLRNTRPKQPRNRATQTPPPVARIAIATLRPTEQHDRRVAPAPAGTHSGADERLTHLRASGRNRWRNGFRAPEGSGAGQQPKSAIPAVRARIGWVLHELRISVESTNTSALARTNPHRRLNAAPRRPKPSPASPPISRAPSEADSCRIPR